MDEKAGRRLRLDIRMGCDRRERMGTLFDDIIVSVLLRAREQSTAVATPVPAVAARDRSEILPCRNTAFPIRGWWIRGGVLDEAASQDVASLAAGSHVARRTNSARNGSTKMIHLFINALSASAGGGLTYVRNVLPRLALRDDVRTTVLLSEAAR